MSEDNAGLGLSELIVETCYVIWFSFAYSLEREQSFLDSGLAVIQKQRLNGLCFGV